MVQDIEKQQRDPTENPDKFKVYEGSYSIKIPELEDQEESPTSEHSVKEAESSEEDNFDNLIKS
jgi:hypothetical protein